MTRHPLSLTIALALCAALAGCESEDAPTQKTVAAEKAAEATTAPVAAAKPTIRYLRSNQAPFACDVLTDQEAAAILGADVLLSDITAERKLESGGTPIDSACMYSFGADKDPKSTSDDAIALRLDVYTDAGIKAQGYPNGADGVWSYRTVGGTRKVELTDNADAAWVDSSHPPDMSLIVRQGEVIVDAQSYPPRSEQENPRLTHATIERFVLAMLDKQKNKS